MYNNIAVIVPNPDITKNIIYFFAILLYIIMTRESTGIKQLINDY